MFDKKSPTYADLDMGIKLGFSGICFYYKPLTMANLLQFVKGKKEEVSEMVQKERAKTTVDAPQHII